MYLRKYKGNTYDLHLIVPNSLKKMSWLNLVSSWCLAVGFLMTNFLCGTGDVFSTLPGPVISTTAGSFQGLKLTPPGNEQSVYAFLGIPYAEPPTGPQRFKKPKPIKYLPGIFQATKKPPACFQLEADLYLPWADNSSVMAEDCLYLNIWAPERRTNEENLKPVMVWIHGGGYTTGSSALDLYDGRAISSVGDVVVVTLNYRLGPFGLLNTLADDALGNAALYDQLLVLHWVQDNIKSFGGDPKKVTLFGESAGAMCTSYLAISPLSSGLFQQILIQSGSSYTPLGGQHPSYGVQTGNELSLLVGCANDTFTLFSHPKEVVDCLRGVPATELVKSYYKQNNSHSERIDLRFQVQVWDELLPEHPSDIFRSKNYTVYDTFVGLTKVEGLPISIFFFPEVYQKYLEGKLIVNKTVATDLLTGFFRSFHIVHPEKPIEFYLKDIGDDQQTIVKAIYEAIGDYIIACPTVYVAEKYAERGAQVHFYRFDHRPSTSPWPGLMDAAHSDDVEFVFGLPIRYPERYQEEETSLSRYTIRIWTNFAKSEDLTLKNGLPWPKYSRSDPQYATLDTDRQTIGTGERKTQCEFWRPYFNAE